MGLSSIVLTILALVGAAFAKVLADEFKAWAPRMTSVLLQVAIARMPPVSRERYKEEWAAYLTDIPGDLSKILVASGFIVAALRTNSRAGLTALLKRALDFSMAVIAVAVMSPLLLIAAILIRFDSPGPVIVKQRRIGRDWKPFDLYRFRTAFETDDGPARTALGIFLHRTSLNEIPSLLNVLRGDMSLVGPPPVTRALLEELGSASPDLSRLVEVKPGLASVSVLDADASLKEDIAKELEYVESQSLKTDLKIMIKTVIAVLTTPTKR